MQVLGLTPDIMNSISGHPGICVLISHQGDSDTLELENHSLIDCFWPSLINCYQVPATKSNRGKGLVMTV